MRPVVIGLCCAATLVVPAVSSSADGRASLRLSDAPSLAVRGSHFRPGERVTVTLFLHSAYRRSQIVRPSGVFNVFFRSVMIPGCLSYTVTASGNRGSRASVHVVAECPNAEPEMLLPRDPLPGKPWKP